MSVPGGKDKWILKFIRMYKELGVAKATVKKDNSRYENVL